MHKFPIPLLSKVSILPLLMFFSLTAGILGCKKEQPVDRRIKQMDPQQTAELARSIGSKVTPEISEGLSLSLWGIDSLVSDPISISIDDLGHIYYTRTNRQKNSEFDIRGHQDWEIGSIQLQTVEDKRAFLHNVLSPENSQYNQWLADLNGDGSHDWKDMTIEKEHVYRLENVDGDGVADLSQLVVDDFNTEVTDVAGAVLKYEDDLFVGVAPDLWRLKDSNGDGVVDEKTSISHGYGIHVGFGGHGMSGLKMGPDGKIYWSIGDIGFNGEGPDGTKWEYPNEGVLVRSNPDGSDFEVFASGLRNTHEFVFDEYGNIISQDNDGDHQGERERLVYIVNGSDTGWRINWQFGKYRDPKNNTYKVWMDEEMWKPRFEGQAAYITPCIENFVSGPTGMAYNPGTALSPEFKNTFFIVEFVGNPARSGVHTFKLNPKGASFELGEHKKILGGILATGLDFGPDGSLYMADWLEGWDTKGIGRIWKMDVADKTFEKEREQTKAILAEDLTKQNIDYLSGLLTHADMRVRQKSQFELAKRGEEGVEIFKKAINQTSNQLARVHGIWGTAQLARENADHAKTLIPLLKDQDPEIRAQAAKWLGDIKYKDAGKDLIPLLKDEYSRARFFAAEALGRIAYEPAVNPILELLIANNDEDAYLRHAGSLALARIGKAEPIVALSDHPSKALRIAAVVALRRLKHPGIVNFLKDQDEFIVTEASRAINDDLSIEGALPALGDLLNDTKFSNEALIRRAINANYRLGNEKALQNLIKYSLKEDSPVEMRGEAMAAIGTWANPSLVDRVDGRYRGLKERDLSEVQNLAFDALMKMSSHSNHLLRMTAVRAVGQLKMQNGGSKLFTILKTDKRPEVREEALKALAAMEYEQMGKAIEQAISDREKSVRVAGLDLLAGMDISKELMVNLLTKVINTKTPEEKQAAVITLGHLPLENSQKALENLLQKMENGNLPPEIRLELAEAINATNSEPLKTRLSKVYSQVSADSLQASYQDALFGGDPTRGENIVFRHQVAQCMKCHSYDDYGGNAGPRLNGIGGKLSREQILEALIDPGKRLSPGFGVVSLDLKEGKTISGILQEENDISVALKVGNKPDTVIHKADIVKRINAPSSMPDMKSYLSKREIRDLVSFLSTLKEDN